MMYTEAQVKELMSKMFDNGLQKGREMEKNMIYNELLDMLDLSLKYNYDLTGLKFR